jgi:hypothetical protein
MCLNSVSNLFVGFLYQSLLLLVVLQSVSEDQAKRFAKFRERKHRVEKDVV